MAVALVVMQYTGTVHPPGGATALIAATQNVSGWLFIGIVALSAAVMIAIALMVNNIERRWPAFWWSPVAPKLEVVLPIAIQELTPGSSVTVSDQEENIQNHIVVSCNEIILPTHFTEQDRQFLKSFQDRLSNKVIAP